MKIKKFLVNILDKIERRLVVSSHEPQVKQKCDRHGNKYWQVYDLYSNQSHTFGSEQDVRVWLENHYHCLN